MRKKTVSKDLRVARFMPPLRHSIPGKEFDVRNSEVIQWLTKSPDILNYVWNNIKNSGSVVYGPETGKWQGEIMNQTMIEFL
ncbi:Hypothetical protein LUCI_0652 [Lucifera butyrica]|uniref:Uncharacterized protein n=1 Tax=Lucifera butyrica TaxID=1351585 RepID=A0A498R5A8_9FIRM|nr:hypothetical protein [Lucifera butyrica]VBB05442.1 Hypothetical protein LUCI_0652 [Lucifera butyrica]